MTRRKGSQCTLALLFSVCGAVHAWGWGSTGHKIIADLAYERLTPRTATEVRAILAGAAALDLPRCNFRTFEDAAVWPDCVREHRISEFRQLTPLHFEDRPLCGQSSVAVCPDGQCVTGAIETARQALRKRDAAPAQRALALAELVHFIADMHQPLHMIDNKDRGGNEVPALYPNHRTLTNLHAVWDDALVKSVIGTRGQRADVVKEQIDVHAGEWAKGTLEEWANQSHQIGVETAYGALPVPQSCHSPSRTLEVLDERYIARAEPQVVAQMGRASVRLAEVLNSTL